MLPFKTKHTQDLSLRGVRHDLNLKRNHLHYNLFLPAPFFRGYIGNAILS